MLGADLKQVMRETIAELRLLGPPASVHIRVFAGDQAVGPAYALPQYVDADIFPYLLVWLLEWAEIDRHRWGQEWIEGSLTAEDRARGVQHEWSFSLRNEHLSEGLFRRTLSLMFWVTG